MAIMDNYSEHALQERFFLHKLYVESTFNWKHDHQIEQVRLPNMPEDISENIVKFIARNILNVQDCVWTKGATQDDDDDEVITSGDLHSPTIGKLECKCFTSDGPLSFGPTESWNVLYFLDARDWLNDRFILYAFNDTNLSSVWQNVKVNKTQTYADQSKAKRRPRISWNSLHPQLGNSCVKVYDGTFEGIFQTQNTSVVDSE